MLPRGSASYGLAARTAWGVSSADRCATETAPEYLPLPGRAVDADSAVGVGPALLLLLRLQMLLPAAAAFAMI